LIRYRVVGGIEQVEKLKAKLHFYSVSDGRVFED
jgi:hypothetical protein